MRIYSVSIFADKENPLDCNFTNFTNHVGLNIQGEKNATPFISIYFNDRSEIEHFIDNLTDAYGAFNEIKEEEIL